MVALALLLGFTLAVLGWGLLSLQSAVVACAALATLAVRVAPARARPAGRRGRRWGSSAATEDPRSRAR
ncbi:hypothetical protein GCM10010170_025720 [Dactylosporangium salmoneum]|uniref:Uncharacterized protein n=1 Tax=Dactylosporangium salmoneum TaxID=53361 RepID=A0ABP5T234_9ACTN